MKRLSKLSIKPNVTKENDFSLSLVEYFCNEFKNNDILASKNNAFVNIKLSNKYKEKYDSIVIDCIDGKMYLRGSDTKDSYFGRLSKFNAKSRKSDAYHCVNYNAKRIINRVKKIESCLCNEIHASIKLENVFDERDNKQKSINIFCKKIVAEKIITKKVELIFDERINRYKKCLAKQDAYNKRMIYAYDLRNNNQIKIIVKDKNINKTKISYDNVFDTRTNKYILSSKLKDMLIQAYDDRVNSFKLIKCSNRILIENLNDKKNNNCKNKINNIENSIYKKIKNFIDETKILSVRR